MECIAYFVMRKCMAWPLLFSVKLTKKYWYTQRFCLGWNFSKGLISEWGLEWECLKWKTNQKLIGSGWWGRGGGRERGTTIRHQRVPNEIINLRKLKLREMNRNKLNLAHTLSININQNAHLLLISIHNVLKLPVIRDFV